MCHSPNFFSFIDKVSFFLNLFVPDSSNDPMNEEYYSSRTTEHKGT